MSRLITASIVSAIDFMTECPPSWKQRAIESATNQLSRIYPEPKPKAMQLGIALETAVQAHAINLSTAGSEHFQWLVQESKNGIFQKTVKRFIEIDNIEYCLYGKIDVWFPNIIKDIKATMNYKGKQKYLNSFQHKLYCYIERIPRFKYIIGEFDEEGTKLINHYAVDYEVQPKENIYEEIVNRIKKFISFLKQDKKLFELYTTKFSRY